MKNKGLKHYGIAVMIPLIILVAMTILPMATLILGEEILLETVPVDPRDLFRGDYVVLNYKINEIDGKVFTENIDVQYTWEWERRIMNKPLYVVLKEGEEGFYEVEGVSFDKPKDQSLYLKAKINYMDKEYLNSKTGDVDFGRIKSVRVDYQLDKYFVPENTGLDLEKASRKGDIAAKVKVLRGYALLRNIFEINN